MTNNSPEEQLESSYTFTRKEAAEAVDAIEEVAREALLLNGVASVSFFAAFGYNENNPLYKEAESIASEIGAVSDKAFALAEKIRAACPEL